MMNRNIIWSYIYGNLTALCLITAGMRIHRIGTFEAGSALLILGAVAYLAKVTTYLSDEKD